MLWQDSLRKGSPTSSQKPFCQGRMLVSHEVHILIAPAISLQCSKYLTYVSSDLMGILVPHFMDGIIIHRFTHRYPVVRTGRVVTKAVGSRVPAPGHTHTVLDASEGEEMDRACLHPFPASKYLLHP